MRYDLEALARQAGVRRKVIALRPIEPPRGMEAEYRRILVRMLNEIARHVRAEMLPELERERALLTTDAAGDRIEGLFGGLRRLVERLYGVATEMAGRIFQAEATRHTDQFAATVRQAIGIDMAAVLRSSPGLEERMSLAALRNAQVIKGLAEDTQKRIAETITRNLTQGGTAKDLSKQLQEAFGFEQKRANLIARNEISNINASLNEFRQAEAGVAEYIWRTSQDERVRDEHIALEGTTHRWDKPGPDNGMHPGEPINCRCTAQAVIRLD
jgi:SPP1 gp7 family putative phage head morphogenesis protein